MDDYNERLVSEDPSLLDGLSEQMINYCLEGMNLTGLAYEPRGEKPLWLVYPWDVEAYNLPGGSTPTM
jgi:hypothetical protein